MGSIPEKSIVRAIADRECNRICRSTIRYLQSLDDDQVLLSGPDSGLKNVWEEICVQQQFQESYFWEAYLDTITPYISYAVERLRRPEMEAIWLQTPMAFEREPDEYESSFVPVCLDEVTLYIRDHYVLRVATDYQNSRIRKFLERPNDRNILPE